MKEPVKVINEDTKISVSTLYRWKKEIILETGKLGVDIGQYYPKEYAQYKIIEKDIINNKKRQNKKTTNEDDKELI